MSAAIMLGTIGVVALIFAGYFLFGSRQLLNRNLLDRRVDLLPAAARRSGRPARPDPLETLLNRVILLDEWLVRMKTATATVLLAAGFFLLFVSWALLRS